MLSEPLPVLMERLSEPAVGEEAFFSLSAPGLGLLMRKKLRNRWLTWPEEPLVFFDGMLTAAKGGNLGWFCLDFCQGYYHAIDAMVWRAAEYKRRVGAG